MKAFGGRAAGLRLERMQSSPLWTGAGFRNRHPGPSGLRDPSAPRPTLGDFLYGGERRVPKAPLPALNPLDGWSKRPASGLRSTWLGHSTVLIEIDGFRVLTDPVWGPRASPSRFAGPKRFQPVPVALSALPPIDLVLVSHDHYDHLDYPTILGLARLGVPFVTSLGVGAHLEAWGVPTARITELDWWESYTLKRRGAKTELEVTTAPSQHFSGRGLKDRNATLWSSLLLRTERHAVFFSGDTGLTTEYTAIADRSGRFDPVMPDGGAFHPVHWGTFGLAMHAWDDPAETLLALGPAQGARLLMPRLGEPIEPDREAVLTPWWRGVDDRRRREPAVDARPR